MNVIAIANRKGGVGKTTTAVNVASELAARGQRVVIVDLDTQRNASIHLGVRHDPPLPSPVFRMLILGEALEKVVEPMSWSAGNERVGFDLVAAGKDLDDAADKMRRAIGGQGHFVLREAIEEAAPNSRWDTVILDCPPSVGDVSSAALVAADWVLIPMVMQTLPFEGLTEVMELIQIVQKRTNPKLKVAGVFATLIDDNTKLSAVVRGKIEDQWPDAVLPVRVRRNNALAEAAERGMPVMFHNPDCNGVHDYRALVGELLARGVA